MDEIEIDIHMYHTSVFNKRIQVCAINNQKTLYEDINFHTLNQYQAVNIKSYANKKSLIKSRLPFTENEIQCNHKSESFYDITSREINFNSIHNKYSA